MVAPRIALTAAHCVVSVRLGHVVPPGAIHIVTGYDRGLFAHHAVAVALTIAPGFDLLRPDATRGADLALITLEADVIPAGLNLADAARGAAVMLGGYSQDRPERVTADTRCQVTGYGVDGEARPLLLHSCAGTRGTSGGAILVRSAGEWRVAGVEVAAYEGRPGGAAVPASAIVALERFRDAHLTRIPSNVSGGGGTSARPG